jgi:hypothetical protein
VGGEVEAWREGSEVVGMTVLLEGWLEVGVTDSNGASTGSGRVERLQLVEQGARA